MRVRVKNLSTSVRVFFGSNVVIQDSAFLYASSLVTAGVGFIASLTVARSLGPTSFAIIAGYSAIVATLAGFTDFGLGTGLIKHTAPHLKGDESRVRAIKYFRLVFLAELVIGLVLLLVGLAFSSTIAGLLGQKELSTGVVRVAIVAAAVASTGAYVGAAMAAYKKFKLNALLSISFSVVRLLATLALWKYGGLTVGNILGLYLMLTVLNVLVGFVILPKDYLAPSSTADLKRAGKKLFTFSAWLTLSFFMTSIMGKLDFFYLLGIKGATEAGVYAAAQQLAVVYTLLLGAIATVLTSHVSEKTNYIQKLAFLKRTLPISAVGAVVFVVSGALAPEVIELLFGPKYAGAAMPLRLLAANLAINFILLPITLLFIPLGKVKVGTMVTAAQLLLSIVLYPFLIGLYGVIGAPLTLIACSLLALIVYPIMLVYFLKKDRSANA